MTPPAEPATTLFTALGDGVWRPALVARGPFEGVQGGAIAALLCAAAEAAAGPDVTTLSTTTSFLRPTPLDDLEVSTTVIQQGRRSVIVESRVIAQGRACARAVTTLGAAIEIPQVPEDSGPSADPESYPRNPARSRHGQPWLMDLMDYRTGPDGKAWFRFNTAITGAESRFARMLAPADWTVGISRQDSWEAPIVKGIPNVDLSVHASRHPVSDWTGIAAGSQWRRAGTGLASGRLFDPTGRLGEVNATLILVA